PPATASKQLTGALTSLKSLSSTFGANLSVAQTRQDFTKDMTNVLTTGADNLTNADANSEAASLLALQTRQQLAQTALSLANQADQGVLRLF
ncbi:flagellin, partial [Bosea sp. TAB14]|uniref:flagellin n=1 Tax=Bosea sp. TAB14 TaxID=3237481 RepID=UPI003F928986